eukprot:gene8066-16548_t
MIVVSLRLLLLSMLLIKMVASTRQIRTFIRNQQISIPAPLINAMEGIYDISVDPTARSSVQFIINNQDQSIIVKERENNNLFDTSVLVGLIIHVIQHNICRQNANNMYKLFQLNTSYPTSLGTYTYIDRNSAQTEELVDWIAEDGTALVPLPRSIIHKYNLLHRGIGALIIDRNCNIFVHQRASTKRIFPSMWDMFIGGVSVTQEAADITLIRELSEELGLDFTEYMSSSHSPLSHSKDLLNESLLSSDKFSNKTWNQFQEIFHKLFIQNDLDTISNSIIPQDNSNYIKYLGKTIIETSYNHCLVDCYAVICSKEMSSSIRFSDGEVQCGKWMSLQDLKDFLQNDEKSFVPDGMLVWKAIFDMLSLK